MKLRLMKNLLKENKENIRLLNKNKDSFEEKYKQTPGII